MAAKLEYRWHLRRVMASREMFQTTDLIGPLAQRAITLSSSQVYRLVVERPERMSLKVLMALMDILDCSMDELIEPVAAASAATGRGKKRSARRPVSVICVPNGRGCMTPTGRDRFRAGGPGHGRPDRAARGPRRGGRAPSHGAADPHSGDGGCGRSREVAASGGGPGGTSRRAPRRQVPGGEAGGRAAHRAATGGRYHGLATVLRRLRPAGAGVSAPRPGLVLLGLRTARRGMRPVRTCAASLLPRSGRAAPAQTVSGPRSP